jgi:hypothetical protein
MNNELKRISKEVVVTLIEYIARELSTFLYFFNSALWTDRHCIANSYFSQLLYKDPYNMSKLFSLNQTVWVGWLDGQISNINVYLVCQSVIFFKM